MKTHRVRRTITLYESTKLIYINLAIGAPHTVEITKENESLGFYLWFDENGHYIEDVTFGSAADKSGLKIGDRLMEVHIHFYSLKLNFLIRDNFPGQWCGH